MAVFILLEAVFMLVASFLIINTIVMIIHERIKEIGMMGALGMTRHEIVRVFFFESLVLALLGALAGVIAGGIATGVASFFPFNFTAMTGGGFDQFPMSGTIFFVFSPAILAQSFIFGLVVAAVCTLFPSLKSAFVEPVEALRR
jgi:putative ABC transport system permease protein